MLEKIKNKAKIESKRLKLKGATSGIKKVIK